MRWFAGFVFGILIVMRDKTADPKFITKIGAKFSKLHPENGFFYTVWFLLQTLPYSEAEIY